MIKELSDKHILHRDIKLENIFLTSSDMETTYLKLGDFGLAKSIKDDIAST
jgi:serine/threonine protein kinase